MTEQALVAPQPLRAEAERLLDATPRYSTVLERMEPAKLIHELQVHRIELEMQNEALTDSFLRANALRAKYFDLFDFAPVGYLTVRASGEIVEANLRAARMLGKTSVALAGLRLHRLVNDVAAAGIDRLLHEAASSPEPTGLQALQLRGNLGMPLYVNAQAQALEDETGENAGIRLVLMDVSALTMARDDVVETLTKTADSAVLANRLLDTQRPADKQ